MLLGSSTVLSCTDNATAMCCSSANNYVTGILFESLTGHGGPISRARASYVEGRELEIRPSQINDLLNLYLSLPSQALSINKIGQGLVGSVSG